MSQPTPSSAHKEKELLVEACSNKRQLSTFISPILNNIMSETINSTFPTDTNTNSNISLSSSLSRDHTYSTTISEECHRSNHAFLQSTTSTIISNIYITTENHTSIRSSSNINSSTTLNTTAQPSVNPSTECQPTMSAASTSSVGSGLDSGLGLKPQPSTSTTSTSSSIPQSIFYTDGSYQASSKLSTKQPAAAGWAFIQLTTLQNQELHCLVESYGPTPTTTTLILTLPSNPNPTPNPNPDNENPTNNSSELYAIYEVLLYLQHQTVQTAIIRTDSKYAINVITKLHLSTKNQVLLTQIHNLLEQISSKVNISFEHVRAHRGDTWNDRADVLAKKGARSSKRIRQVFPKPLGPLSTEPLVPIRAPIAQPIQDLDPTRIIPQEILPPTGRQDLSSYISLFSTKVPINSYHIYEWYTGTRNIPEKEKLTKSNFEKLSNSDQLQELSHLGLHITTLEQGYNLLLHGLPIIKHEYNPNDPFDTVHHELPHIVLSANPVHLLIQHQLRLSRKISLLKQTLKSKKESVTRYLSLQKNELRLAQQAGVQQLAQMKEQFQQERMSLLDQLSTFNDSIFQHEELLKQISTHIKNRQKRIQYQRSSSLRHAPMEPYIPKHLQHYRPFKTSPPSSLPSNPQEVAAQLIDGETLAYYGLRFTHSSQLHPTRKKPKPVRVIFDTKSKKDIPVTSDTPMHSKAVLENIASTLHSTTFPTPMPLPTNSNLNVATININSLHGHHDKVSILATLMKQHRLDILNIIDTRLSKRSAGHVTKQFSNILGPGTRAFHATNTADFSTTNPGGICIVVNPRLSHIPVSSHIDPSALGTHMYVTLAMPTGNIMNVASYFPYNRSITETREQSLHNRISVWLKNSEDTRTPKQYLQDSISVWISEHITASVSNSVIVSGDFNAKWSSTTPDDSIQDWATTNQLSNPFIQHRKQLAKALQTDPKKPSQQPRVIDHTLFRSTSSLLIPQSCTTIHGPEWKSYSDHKLLIFRFHNHHSPPFNSFPEPILPQVVPTELNLSNPTQVAAYTGIVQNWVSSTAHLAESDPISYLTSLTHVSTISAAKVSKHKRKQKFQLHKFDPEYYFLQLVLKFMTQVQHGLRRLKPTAIQKHIIQQKTQFNKSIRPVGLSIITQQKLLDSYKSPLWWSIQNYTSPTIPILSEQISSDIYHIIKTLSRIRRTDATAHFKKLKLEREKKHQEGYLRDAIKSIIGHLKKRPKNHLFSLSTLSLPDNSVETSPSIIHNMLNSSFQQWYQAESSSSPSIHTTPPTISSLDHAQRLLSDQSYFEEMTQSSEVPADIKHLLYQSISQKPKPEAVQFFTNVFQDPPSEEQFLKKIVQVSKDSSPGPSGLTYNMIKAWPIDAKHVAYTSLCQIWTSRETPPEWKWKWLVAIPKSSDPYPSVQDLRPISLVEALRKIWISLINHQINKAITDFSILHPSQHGSIPTRGTCTASLVHLNYLEETLHSHHFIHRSSWDMKRAFDSVSKVMMRISWLRIGIPPNIADYLVQLDEGGTTVLKTPFSLHHWNEAPYQSAISTSPTPSTYHQAGQGIGVGVGLSNPNSDNPSVLQTSTFQADNGTGQGDVTSSTIWACFLDILLTMLHNDSLKNPSLLYGEHGRQYHMQEIAYVDDIESSTLSATAMQRKADIVSAFCIITGIQLSYSKLRRSLTVRPKTDSISFLKEFLPMNVHIKPWTAQQTKVKHDQFTEYLGIKNDLQGQPFVTQFDDTSIQLKQFVHQLTLSSASARVKLDVLVKSVYPAIQYQMRIANYPYEQYKQLDKTVYPLLKQITLSPPTYPYALLHLPAKYGCIGIPRLSHHIQYSKLGILLRSLHAPSNSPHYTAITAMLSRQATLQHTPLATNQAIILNNVISPPNWLLSLLQWLDTFDLQIKRQGTPTPHLYTSASSEQKDLLLTWNIQYPEDVLPSNITNFSPSALPTELSSIYNLLIPHVLTPSQTTLRQYQLWKLPVTPTLSNLPDTYAEIQGWDTETNILHIKRWKASFPSGNILHLLDTVSIPYNNVFLNETVHHPRYLYQRTPSESHLNSITIIPRAILRTHPQFTLPHTPIWSSFLTPHSDATTIHVSYTTHQISLASTLLIPSMMTSQPTSSCTGYIYITSENNVNNTNISSIITINNLLDYVHQAQVDMFLTTICLHLSANHHLHPTINPTRATTVNQLTDPNQRTKYRYHSFQLVTSALQQIQLGARLETGTKTADYIKHQQTLQYVTKLIRKNKIVQPSPLIQITLSPTLLLSNLFTPNTWFIIKKNSFPLLTSAVTHIDESTYQKYLRKRLVTSHTSHDWEDATPRLTSYAFRLQSASLSSRASLTRVLYDKGFHGRTLQKHHPNKSDTCNNCPLPDSIYHWMCECTHNTSSFFRSSTVNKIKDWFKSKLAEFNSIQEAHIQPVQDRTKNNQLVSSNLTVTVGKFYLENILNPTNGVRLWTSNWSTPMIEDLYTIIKTQQYPPQFFSINIHNLVLHTIQILSRFLAKGLTDIWKCKAATISSSNKPSAPNQLSAKQVKLNRNHKPRNTITKYFQPVNSATTISSTNTQIHTQLSPYSTSYSTGTLAGAETIPPTDDTTQTKLTPYTTSVSTTLALVDTLSPTNDLTHTQVSLKPFLQPPSTEQLSQLTYAFQAPHDDTILINKHDIPITKYVIRCLNPHQPTSDQWLNDTVINFYLKMLIKKFQSVTNKLHIFTTYFMENLSPTITSSEVTAFHYASVSRFTHHRTRTNINIFEKDIVLIPINYHNQHWTLAVIYPKEREVAYLDSLNSHKANDYLHVIKQYLQEESNVTNTPFTSSDWLFHTPTVPQQCNGYDCGVYLLTFAHLIVHGHPITTINPQDIPAIRTSISNAIITNKLPASEQPTLIPEQPTLSVVATSASLSTRSNKKRKVTFTGSYNEDHIERKQRNIPTEFDRPTDLQFHPTDAYANNRAGIATSRIASGGRGLFALREFDIGEDIAHFFGGVKITRENLHLHIPSLYAFFDDHNNIFIDPYDPTTGYISCSAAYVNDNIQDPDRNNTEFVTFTDGTVSLRVIKKILKYEEVGTSYGSDHWKTLTYPLSLLLIAQKAYHKENDPEWLQLIATKRAMEAAHHMSPSFNIDVNHQHQDESATKNTAEVQAAHPETEFETAKVVDVAVVNVEADDVHQRKSVECEVEIEAQGEVEDEVEDEAEDQPEVKVEVEVEVEVDEQVEAATGALVSNATTQSPTMQSLFLREQLIPHPEPVAGDGNCFFHAIAQQLNELEDLDVTHTEIRHNIIPWLLTHLLTDVSTEIPQPLYRTSSTFTYVNDIIPEWETYIQRMSVIGTYAEQPQIWATAAVYHVRIRVFRSFENITIIPIGSPYKHTIYLQYEPVNQHYYSLTPLIENVETTQEQIMQLPMDQLQLIISFSSHIAAINHLQSQNLQHQQWIQHQLHQLRLLQTNQRKLQIFPIINQLEMEFYIIVNATYTPVFHNEDIFFMLYHIPHIGIFTTIDNNQIQLKYITSHNDTNTFPSSTLMHYITNTPIVCLVTDSTISIYQIKDTHIQQLVNNATNTAPQPTPNTSNKRKNNNNNNNITNNKKVKTNAQIAKLKWYYDNKHTIAKKQKARSKVGAIQLLNQNPDTDIATLIQQNTVPDNIRPTIIATTNKTWNDILNYNNHDTILVATPSLNNKVFKSNKRKREDSETVTTPITSFLTNTITDNVKPTIIPKDFKTSDKSRHCDRKWYQKHRDSILQKKKEANIQRKLEEANRLQNTKTSLQEYFTKSTRNEDDKPP